MCAANTEMFDITKKVALITGGAKGIGLCLGAELLRNEAKGVALLDIDEVNGKLALEKLSSEYQADRVIFIKADVSQRLEFEEAFEKTIKTFGHLDIVVNNAGIVHELQWEKCIAVNLQGCMTGSLLAIDKYFPGCLAGDEGIILNMSSIVGLEPQQEIPVYVGTKCGILGFSRALSGPLRSHHLNVKILTICPSTTTTTIMKPNLEQVPEELIISMTKRLKYFPRQRPGELACHIVSIIKEGKNGSVWVVDGNVSTEIQFPDLIDISQNKLKHM